jgi:hypothetical protein
MLGFGSAFRTHEQPCSDTRMRPRAAPRPPRTPPRARPRAHGHAWSVPARARTGARARPKRPQSHAQTCTRAAERGAAHARARAAYELHSFIIGLRRIARQTRSGRASKGAPSHTRLRNRAPESPFAGASSKRPTREQIGATNRARSRARARCAPCRRLAERKQIRVRAAAVSSAAALAEQVRGGASAR